MGERALLIENPGAGKRHAKDGDLAECVRLLTAAGFDIDLRETGTDGPSSADLAKAAMAEGFRVVLVAGGDGTVAPAAIALLETEMTLGVLPFGSHMNIANGLGIPLEPIDAARSSQNATSSDRTSARSPEGCSSRPAASGSTPTCSARHVSPSVAAGARRSGGSCAGRRQTHIAWRSRSMARPSATASFRSSS